MSDQPAPHHHGKKTAQISGIEVQGVVQCRCRDTWCGSDFIKHTRFCKGELAVEMPLAQ